MKLRVVLVLASLGWKHAALAEGGCPPGQYPYNTPAARQCIPIPGGGNSGPSKPVAIYEDRWGAIAVDGSVSSGGVGTALGLPSKRKAEKAALAQCRTTGGGKGCEIEFSYRNQCAVISSGDNFMQSSRGPTIESVSERALNACKEKTTNCSIYYSGCSYPVRIQ
jgi:hypothetical protein